MSLPILRGVIWTDVSGVPIGEIGENEGLVTAHRPDGREVVLAAFVLEEYVTDFDSGEWD